MYVAARLEGFTCGMNNVKTKFPFHVHAVDLKETRLVYTLIRVLD